MNLEKKNTKKNTKESTKALYTNSIKEVFYPGDYIYYKVYQKTSNTWTNHFSNIDDINEEHFGLGPNETEIFKTPAGAIYGLKAFYERYGEETK